MFYDRIPTSLEFSPFCFIFDSTLDIFDQIDDYFHLELYLSLRPSRKLLS